MTIFKRANADNTQFRELVVMLDADLKIRDGVEHDFYAPFNSIENLRHVIIAYIDNKPVGCGAFKRYDEQTAEIKRMFVLPGYRGHGTGLHILNELELWAMELHYSACILETGKKQPEAIRLYQKAGYALIKNYGQYQHIENSICMSKLII